MKIKSFKRFFKKHFFFTGIFVTLFLGFFLRTYNLENRIPVGSDSVRDVIVAQVALQNHEFPLIGSFSSAGPFVFGPLYFWFNMLALTLMPFSFKTPWILMNIVGFLTVAVMMVIGYRLEGKRLCIILGLITAFCPQFISRSTGLTQHSLVGITSTLLILFFILFYQTKKIRYSFLMGISLGTALSMHYQALNLLLFLVAIFAIPKMNLKTKIISFVIMGIGIIIPSLPLLYWDSMQNFANYRNLMDYILIGQYRIYVANSWRIYLFSFLPDYWSNVVGGNKPVAVIVELITFFTLAFASLKRKVKGEIFILSSIFAVLLVIIRYYRGERFDGYMIYIAPFIFLLSGWALLTFYNWVKQSRFVKAHSARLNIFIILSFLFFAIVILSDFKNASQFIFVTNDHEATVLSAKYALIQMYPTQNFHLYDYKWSSSDYTYPLGEFLTADKKISRNGIAIGAMRVNSCSTIKPIYTDGNWELVRLGPAPEKVLIKNGWVPVNPEDVYNDLITRWTKKQKLTSTFHLSDFIVNKLKGN